MVRKKRMRKTGFDRGIRLAVASPEGNTGKGEEEFQAISQNILFNNGYLTQSHDQSFWGCAAWIPLRQTGRAIPVGP